MRFIKQLDSISRLLLLAHFILSILLIIGSVAVWNIADSAQSEVELSYELSQQAVREIPKLTQLRTEEYIAKMEASERQVSHGMSNNFMLLEVGKSFAAMLFCYIAFSLSLMYRLFLAKKVFTRSEK